MNSEARRLSDKSKKTFDTTYNEQHFAFCLLHEIFDDSSRAAHMVPEDGGAVGFQEASIGEKAEVLEQRAIQPAEAATGKHYSVLFDCRSLSTDSSRPCCFSLAGTCLKSKASNDIDKTRYT